MLIFLLFLSLPEILFGARKVYWHFYITCYQDEKEEHLWLTLVEVEEKKAFPQQAELVESLGGSMKGTWLAFLKGAALRKAGSVRKSVCCKEHVFGGCVQRGNKVISWTESWTDKAYAIGKVRGRAEEEDGFRISTVPRRVLNPDGSWFVLGPAVIVSLSGGEPEMMRQSKLIYDDPYVEVSRCGKRSRDKYRPIFTRNWKLKGTYRQIGQLEFSNFAVKRYLCVYSLMRSHSPKHPIWKRE